MARSLAVLVLVGAALLSTCGLTAALSEGLVAFMDADCTEKLNTIYKTYYPAPAGTPCVNLMNTTLTELDPAKCPDQNATVACFNEQRTQWLAFVAMCEVFHWSDFNQGPVVPPGEGNPEPATSRRRLMQNTAESEGTSTNAPVSTSLLALQQLSQSNNFYADIAYTTSGPNVINGCFPTMTDPRDFYLYLEGELANTSAAGNQFAVQAAALLSVAIMAATALLVL